jgi:hypothetical protein
MTVLTKTSTFKRTVTAHIPDENKLDATVEIKFIAEYESVDRNELDDMIAEGLSDKQLLNRVLKGVHEVEGDVQLRGDKGEELTKEGRAEIVKLNIFAGAATVREFFDAFGADPKRKNSKTSPRR